MLGKFFYGQLSLSEAFWKFCVLGLTANSFIARLLMTQLKQRSNYDMNFLRVAISSITDSTRLAFCAFYIATFLALVVYSIICLGGMWNTYKNYDKSKTLAMICLIFTIGLISLAINYSLYK